MNSEPPTSARRPWVLKVGLALGGLALLGVFVVYMIAMHHDQTITTRVARAIGQAAHQADHVGPFGAEKRTLIEDADRATFDTALQRYDFSVVRKNDRLLTVVLRRAETLPWPERLVYPASTGVNLHFNENGVIADLSEAKEFRK